MSTGTRRTDRHGARRSFTLTELLVVVMIISLLASTVMFAMYGAVEEARAARTRTQIVRLNDLLMTRWESYRTRVMRLPLPAEVRRNPRRVAIARLNALRDLIRMELPDRVEDVRDLPITIPLGEGETVQVAIPAVWHEYQRRATAEWLAPAGNRPYEDAECLYMIIASIRDLDGNGLDFLKESEIGDLDGNGMPEILDAWGNPIRFIRWPAGFVAHPGSDHNWGTERDIPNYSDVQGIVPDFDREPPPDASHADGDAEADSRYIAPAMRDPFDPLRVDDRFSVPIDPSGSGDAHYFFNFALHPLIFSAGPDGRFDLVRFDYDDDDPQTPLSFNYYRGDSGRVQNDPYSILRVSRRRLGEPFLDSSGYVDNIHNHAMGDG